MTLTTTPFAARATAAEVLNGTDLTSRRMIVTGGASGLGTQTVRALAGAGARVTIATRNAAIAQPILDEFPQLVDVAEVDLADLASVKAFTDAWGDEPLHALVANAGVMALPERQVNAQGWELHLAINFLGHFALANGLHSALKAGKGRVVTVSSGAQLLTGIDFEDPQFEHRPYDALLAYAQSKTASVLLAVGIAQRWAADGITANSCAPGSIHTNLGRHIPPELEKLLGTLDDDGNQLTPDYFKTPEQGAATATLLAASPLLEGVTGRYFEDNQEATIVDGGPHHMAGGPTGMANIVAKWSLDPTDADRLWDLATVATA
jgi:NAD(P)-dependent dehydrogenase (short-subunit alcohol dehydrogenase family)